MVIVSEVRTCELSGSSFTSPPLVQPTTLTFPRPGGTAIALEDAAPLTYSFPILTPRLPWTSRR
jgi:hypothetical protein